MALRLVSSASELDDVVAQVAAANSYALDTEFHRERTYWAGLALLQIAWPDTGSGPGGVALIDPLSVDVAPLARVLAGPGVMIAHAAEQDLEILERVCGRGPSRLLDTQIAAGFVGRGSASLSSLTESYLHLELPKGDRLTDWRVRPLTDSQLEYAAADVEPLLPLAEALMAELDGSGRRAWAEEECEVVRIRTRGAALPNRAWWKLRDARSLKGPARGIAQEVAAWRERRAQEIDQPVRSVLPDLAVQSIAHRPPPTAEALNQVRGMDGRRLRPALAEEVLGAVQAGRALTAADLDLPPVDEVPRELRAPVALVMAWVGQIGRDERIDTTLLATRADIATYLRGDESSRLATGWRSEILAGPIKALVAGEAALTFEGAGRLVLESRSRRPYPEELPG